MLYRGIVSFYCKVWFLLQFSTIPVSYFMNKNCTHEFSMKFVYFLIHHTSCWSFVGQVFMSGGQPISIGHGCDFIGTVLHEIMHAVGFFHTSSRYDRDSYVVVMTGNVIPGKYDGINKFYCSYTSRGVP